MRIYFLLLLSIFLLLFLMPAVCLAAQVAGVEAPSWDYWVLVINGLIAGLGVQLAKWLLRWLKQEAAYLIPVLSMVIGTLSAWLLNAFGIDIGPIEEIMKLGILSGALAGATFATIKEGHNRYKAIA